jgi:glycosyltransferase involved in cell wall biosynthesis
MKVLYILQNPNLFSKDSNVVGGHIAHIIGVIEALQRRGHEIIVGALSKIPYWESNQIQYRLFRTQEFPLKFARGLVRQFQITRQINNVIAVEQPAVLYVRWAPNMFFGMIRKKYPDLPIVVESNDTLQMPLYMRSLGFVEKQLFRLADKSYIKSATLIAAVSEEIKKFILSHHPAVDARRIITNPNGVDTARFCNAPTRIRETYDIPSSATLIGWAGNYRRWHHLDLLIRVFQRLKGDNCCLVIIGTGPEDLARELQELSRKCPDARVIFTGPVPFDQMPAYLSACDILVSPQTTTVDGTFYQSPIKLYEYMAVGKAIVAARIGQIAEVIRDNQNGLLYEYDSEASLVRVLEKLIKDQHLRARLGVQARKDAVEKHSWDSRVAVLMEALQRTMAIASSVPN